MLVENWTSEQEKRSVELIVVLKSKTLNWNLIQYVAGFFLEISGNILGNCVNETNSGGDESKTSSTERVVKN